MSWCACTTARTTHQNSRALAGGELAHPICYLRCHCLIPSSRLRTRVNPSSSARIAAASLLMALDDVYGRFVRDERASRLGYIPS